MNLKLVSIYVLCAVLLSSCQADTTVYTGPVVNAGPVTISATLNSNGEIVIGGALSIPTPLGIRELGLSWEVGFETTIKQASTKQYTLFILYKDESGQIIQNEYAINEPFEINFSDEQWVRQIKNPGSGNIIVAVEYKVAKSDAAQAQPQEPINNVVPTKNINQSNITPTAIANQAPCTNVTITVTDTNNGDIIHIQCSNWVYDTPLLAKGVYAVDPDNKFFVYCSNSGDVYMMRIGDTSLSSIENIQKKMPAFQTGYVSLSLSIIEDSTHHHFVKILDQNSGQDTTVKVPLSFSR